MIISVEKKKNVLRITYILIAGDNFWYLRLVANCIQTIDQLSREIPQQNIENKLFTVDTKHIDRDKQLKNHFIWQ